MIYGLHGSGEKVAEAGMWVRNVVGKKNWQIQQMTDNNRQKDRSSNTDNSNKQHI